MSQKIKKSSLQTHIRVRKSDKIKFKRFIRKNNFSSEAEAFGKLLGKV